jgi:hypothetical protein
MDEEMRMWTEVCVASSADDPAAATAIQHSTAHTQTSDQESKRTRRRPAPWSRLLSPLVCVTVWAGPKGRCSGGLYWKSRMTG